MLACNECSTKQRSRSANNKENGLSTSEQTSEQEASFLDYMSGVIAKVSEENSRKSTALRGELRGELEAIRHHIDEARRTYRLITHTKLNDHGIDLVLGTSEFVARADELLKALDTLDERSARLKRWTTQP